jgi:hypothetical protein
VKPPGAHETAGPAADSRETTGIQHGARSASRAPRARALRTRDERAQRLLLDQIARAAELAHYALCRAVLGVFIRAVLGWYRRRGRRAGVPDGQSGTVTVVQRFG